MCHSALCVVCLFAVWVFLVWLPFEVFTYVIFISEISEVSVHELLRHRYSLLKSKMTWTVIVVKLLDFT